MAVARRTGGAECVEVSPYVYGDVGYRDGHTGWPGVWPSSGPAREGDSRPKPAGKAGQRSKKWG